MKVGPFLIIEERGPVNYKLDLLKDSKRYPVFHVLLLELVDSNTPLQQYFQYEMEKEDEYEVEEILG